MLCEKFLHIYSNPKWILKQYVGKMLAQQGNKDSCLDRFTTDLGWLYMG
jgi:hypothetical protein